MRALLAALIIGLSAAPAQAWWTTDIGASDQHQGRQHVRGHQYARNHYAHYASNGGCAHLGGKQCGCIAMQHVGLSDPKFHAVRSWFVFPRTQPHVGAAAIWRGVSHVEIVTAVNSDGTVATTGSVGFSRVPIGRLVFVDPHR